MAKKPKFRPLRTLLLRRQPSASPSINLARRSLQTLPTHCKLGITLPMVMLTLLVKLDVVPTAANVLIEGLVNAYNGSLDYTGDYQIVVNFGYVADATKDRSNDLAVVDARYHHR
ncbi:MAG: hypothetical protein MZU97_18295 [Bacillus subtilis]|nr:hypothetical protein [Bacillus subtilis]